MGTNHNLLTFVTAHKCSMCTILIIVIKLLQKVTFIVNMSYRSSIYCWHFACV